MILAVLEARGGLIFSNKDIFVNIAGGLKITEPALDMAMACSLISSLLQKPVPADMIIFGEIGLSGELRAVPQPNLRLKEASKLGFKKALTPLKRGTQKESPTPMSEGGMYWAERLNALTPPDQALVSSVVERLQSNPEATRAGIGLLLAAVQSAPRVP